jgi:hypothetical protein
MFVSTKKNSRQVIRCMVPYRGDSVFAHAVVIWGRQAPHVAIDSPRYFDQPIPTTVRRLDFESQDGQPVRLPKRDYRELRAFVLERAQSMSGIVA